MSFTITCNQCGTKRIISERLGESTKDSPIVIDSGTEYFEMMKSNFIEISCTNKDCLNYATFGI